MKMVKVITELYGSRVLYADKNSLLFQAWGLELIPLDPEQPQKQPTEKLFIPWEQIHHIEEPIS